jgi:hypothetical protein
LPPTYRTAGRACRAFRAGLANRRPGATTFRHRWDLDADGRIDTAMGNTVRKVAVATRCAATCFVEDPVSGRTGVASAELEP